jgi:hypothetical protein
MLSDSAVLWLFLGSTPVRTIFHVFTEQYVTSVLLKTFRSLQAPALVNFVNDDSVVSDVTQQKVTILQVADGF